MSMSGAAATSSALGRPASAAQAVVGTDSRGRSADVAQEGLTAEQPATIAAVALSALAGLGCLGALYLFGGPRLSVVGHGAHCALLRREREAQGYRVRALGASSLQPGRTRRVRAMSLSASIGNGGCPCRRPLGSVIYHVSHNLSGVYFIRWTCNVSGRA